MTKCDGRPLLFVSTYFLLFFLLPLFLLLTDRRWLSANWVNQLQPLYIAGTVFSSANIAPGTRRADPDKSPDFQLQFISSVARGNPGTIGSTAPLASWSTEEEHPAEKILLLKHLARIERETGWKTSDRATNLRMLWGLG